MLKRLALVLAVFALVAAAGTVPKVTIHQITLVKPVVVNGTALKAGEYKLVFRDAKVTLTAKDGGATVETPVKVEAAPSKFDTTVITYQKNNTGQAVLSEIDLGGSKTTLMFAH